MWIVSLWTLFLWEVVAFEKQLTSINLPLEQSPLQPTSRWSLWACFCNKLNNHCQCILWCTVDFLHACRPSSVYLDHNLTLQSVHNPVYISCIIYSAWHARDIWQLEKMIHMQQETAVVRIEVARRSCHLTSENSIAMLFTFKQREQ